jgi:hypothetical protein
MDKYEISVATFDKFAEKYQAPFLVNAVAPIEML